MHVIAKLVNQETGETTQVIAETVEDFDLDEIESLLKYKPERSFTFMYDYLTQPDEIESTLERLCLEHTENMVSCNFQFSGFKDTEKWYCVEFEVLELDEEKFQQRADEMTQKACQMVKDSTEELVSRVANCLLEISDSDEIIVHVLRSFDGKKWVRELEID